MKLRFKKNVTDYMIYMQTKVVKSDNIMIIYIYI